MNIGYLWRRTAQRNNNTKCHRIHLSVSSVDTVGPIGTGGSRTGINANGARARQTDNSCANCIGRDMYETYLAISLALVCLEIAIDTKKSVNLLDNNINKIAGCLVISTIIGSMRSIAAGKSTCWCDMDLL